MRLDCVGGLVRDVLTDHRTRGIFFAGVLATYCVPAGLSLVCGSFGLATSMLTASQRKKVASAKLKELEEELEKARLYATGLTDEECAKIAACYTIEELKAIQRGKHGERISAQSILRWYLLRALEAHKKTNCLVAMELEAAVSSAAFADKHYKETGEQFPLHGIPFSVKDNIGVHGTDSTLGIATYCFQETKTSPMVNMFKNAGGVLVGKTNIPQMLLSYECHNYLFGPALNPYDPTKTPGGSSGGEAALLALRGAMFGIGTDIGGSIRIPAHFCGIYGLKPSYCRVSARHNRASIGGQEAVSAVAGPMAPNISNLVESFRMITNGELWKYDGMTLNVPFREDMYKSGKTKKLRVGFYIEDGCLGTSPACARAVVEACAALEAQGHTVVPFTKPDGVVPLLTFFKLVGADLGVTFFSQLGNEPCNPHLAGFSRAMKTPLVVKYILGKLLLLKDTVLARLLLQMRPMSITEYWRVVVTRNEERHDFVDAMRRDDLDVVIAPGLALPAPELGITAKLPHSMAHTGYYNLLDNAVVTVPVTTVDASKDGDDKWPAPNVQSARNPIMRSRLREMYDAKSMHGLPVGVQVVGHRLSEEFVLGVADQLTSALKAAQ